MILELLQILPWRIFYLALFIQILVSTGFLLSALRQRRGDPPICHHDGWHVAV